MTDERIHIVMQHAKRNINQAKRAHHDIVHRTSKIASRIVLPLLAWASLCACTDRPSAFDYRSTPVEGWELGDTLKYHVDTIAASGNYRFSLGIRTSASTPYPYQSLWLVIKQHWHNPEQEVTDTIQYQLTNDRGDAQGHGVSLYQYDQDIKTLLLPQGASADISVYHIMRSEMIVGIADVGIKLQKTP